MTFRRKHTIRLRNTDAAGVLFFAEQLVLVHETYEAFLEENNFSLQQILRTQEFALPIVHVESGYHRPVRVGDVLQSELHTERVGATSFTLVHQLYREGILVGKGKSVHVCIDPATGTKKNLPSDLVAALRVHLVDVEETGS